MSVTKNASADTGAGAGAAADADLGAPNRRILVVDDNRAIHDDFRKILVDPLGATSALADLEAVLFGQGRPRVDPPRFALDGAFQGEEGHALVRQARDEGRPYA